MRFESDQKGFTLIELLAVFTIVGILAGVIIVKLNYNRSRARIVSFKESMSGIVPAGTVCRDQGGDVQVGDADGTNSICSVPGSPNIPVIVECTGSGNLELTESSSSGGLNTDTWSVKATCTRSDGEKCLAVCDVTGCEFSGPGCL